MGLHTETAIYKVATDLLHTVTNLVKNMPRDFKRSVGSKISDECIEIMMLIFRANVAENKVPYLSDLLERIQVCNLLLRLSKDQHLITPHQYAVAIKLIDSVAKQANGWRSHSQSRLSGASHG